MKMIAKTTLLLATLLATTIANTIAQTQYPVLWDEKPAVHNLTAEQKKHSAVFILDQRRLEYKQSTTDKDVYLYRTIHRIIHLTDSKGLESFNKYTIPVGEDRKIVSIKARTILPNGKVINVKEDDIKTSKAESGSQQYLFAMNGVEQGAEVEVLYTERRPFAVFSSETFQTVVPVVRADFSLIAPENLSFDAVGYNGFPKAVDSTVAMQHFYHAQSNNIDALEEEEYANFNANLQRVDYKLSYVIGEKSGVRRFTWADLAKELQVKYLTFTDRERTEAKKYLEAIGITEQDTELDKIQRIENKMKKTISMSDDLPDDELYEEFDHIVAKKLTNEKGFARLFAACLSEAGVEYEFGLSNSRFSHVIDEKLELWTALNEFVLYFPNQKMYLAPTAIEYRAPYVHYGMMGNKGLFCLLTGKGRKQTAEADIRTIPVLPKELSGSGVEANITFTEDGLTPQVALTHSLYGYPAITLRTAFQLLEKEKEKEIVQNLADIGAKAGDIKDYKIENTSYKSYYTNTPLKMNVNLDAPQLMEKAGPKYLFKVGVLLGKQAEMYKDETRKQPFDVNYKHTLPRTINIKIPEGYKVVNPEAVRMNVTDKGRAAGDATMGFISDYKMNGNTMEISINEFYNQINYPVSDYAVFRKVINAAADFNKVVLVLQKI